MNRAYEKLCNYTQQCPVTFGVGSIATVKDAMGMLGAKKLFVVYDQGVKMSGLAEKVTKSLDEQGVDYITYDDITAEPVEDVVDKAYEVAKEAGCDGVLGLGGGSPMDTAKIISVLLKKGGKTITAVGTEVLNGASYDLASVKPNDAITDGKTVIFDAGEKTYLMVVSIIKLEAMSYELRTVYDVTNVYDEHDANLNNARMWGLCCGGGISVILTSTMMSGPRGETASCWPTW